MLERPVPVVVKAHDHCVCWVYQGRLCCYRRLSRTENRVAGIEVAHPEVAVETRKLTSCIFLDFDHFLLFIKICAEVAGG